MFGDFWKGVGGKLSDRWAAALFSPAFAFWCGGLAAWLLRPGPSGAQERLRELSRHVQGLSPIVQGLYVVAPLVLVTLSGLALQQLAPPVLRLLQGYWPRPFAPLASLMRRRLSGRADARSARLRDLAALPPASLTAEQLAERARLQRRHRRVPVPRAQRMPTRLGNVLRASESRIRSRYGLDPIVCWPRLWLLLPDTTRQEITAARTTLMLTVQTLVTAALFAVWTVWTWWALPISLVVAFASLRRALPAAVALGDLFEASFDLHRRLLYEAARWPLPTNPSAERAEGARLTTYLTTGSRATTPEFT
ncbi:hypothetical protein [Sphaerisporangium dianthi]|uniref:Uncharacterized protein n=1 Tax=Sphaerisporangium dianthi TaxID=1436120 RepID=A0ABV9CI00_9ACTN